MTKRLMVLSLVGLVAACGKAKPGTDAGPGGNQQIIVNVTGTVQYDPSELQWRGYNPVGYTNGTSCSNGQLQDGTAPDETPVDGGFPDASVSGLQDPSPPCLAGDKFNVEDAIKALANLPPLESEASISASGVFDVPNVNVTDTTLALVGSVQDPSGLIVGNDSAAAITASTPNGTYSGYGLGKPPFTQTNTLGCPIYVTSVAFMEYIAAAISTQANPVSYSDLIANGVGVVHVTQSDGITGMPGAELMHVYGSGSNQTTVAVANNTTVQPPFSIFYLNDSLTGVQPPGTNYTSNSGMIVLENVGSAQNFTAQCMGNSCSGTFPVVLIGSRVGTVLETFFQEGVANPTCSGMTPQ